MSEPETDLDRAVAAMLAAPDNEALRLRFHARLADAELVLMLEREVQEGAVAPRLLDLEDGPVALAFEGEDRLAQALGAETAYVALPGRVIVAGLAGQGVALGLNLGAAAPSTLLPPAAVDWLAGQLALAPDRTADRPEAFAPPDLAAPVLAALGERLAPAGASAAGALVARVRYAGGRWSHLVAFPAAAPGSEPALARAVAEAARFSLPQETSLDAAFLGRDDPRLPALAAVAVVLDLTLPPPPPDPEPAPAPIGPGMDPARPPRLIR